MIYWIEQWLTDNETKGSRPNGWRDFKLERVLSGVPQCSVLGLSLPYLIFSIHQ